MRISKVPQPVEAISTGLSPSLVADARLGSDKSRRSTKRLRGPLWNSLKSGHGRGGLSTQATASSTLLFPLAPEYEVLPLSINNLPVAARSRLQRVCHSPVIDECAGAAAKAQALDARLEWHVG